MPLTLILPCFNPPQGWEQNICTVYRQFCAQIKVVAEVIIVFDGMSDAVTEQGIVFLQQQIPSIQIVSYPDNRGKGYAIRQGVMKARGEIIIYTDIDFPYTIESMFEVYQSLYLNQCDVAIGVKDASYYGHLPAARRVISRCLQSMIKLFLSTPITDTQCGLKGFRSNVTPLFLQTTIDRYLFDLEFVRNSFRQKKFRIKAVPVTLNEGVHFRKMNYAILLPEMLNFVKLMLKRNKL